MSPWGISANRGFLTEPGLGDDAARRSGKETSAHEARGVEVHSGSVQARGINPSREFIMKSGSLYLSILCAASSVHLGACDKQTKGELNDVAAKSSQAADAMQQSAKERANEAHRGAAEAAQRTENALERSRADIAETTKELEKSMKEAMNEAEQEAEKLGERIENASKRAKTAMKAKAAGAQARAQVWRVGFERTYELADEAAERAEKAYRNAHDAQR